MIRAQSSDQFCLGSTGFHVNHSTTHAANIDIAGGSDVGRKRSENQDHFLVAQVNRELEILETDVVHECCDRLYGSQPARLLVVADGMGGHVDGAKASEVAVQACARYMLERTNWFSKASVENEVEFMTALEHSLEVIQDSIFDVSGPEGRQMGTTVTMAYVMWPRLYVVHAGDSRCYLLRNGELSQLTTDHTLAQRLLEDNALTAEQAATSRWRHVLWNCVGGNERKIETQVVNAKLQSNDSILLCSDGLSEMLSDDRIREIIRYAKSSREAVDALILAANDAGGHDNISVVLARFGDGQLPIEV